MPKPAVSTEKRRVPVEFSYNKHKERDKSGNEHTYFDLAKVEVMPETNEVEITMPSPGPAKLSREHWDKLVELVNAQW